MGTETLRLVNRVPPEEASDEAKQFPAPMERDKTPETLLKYFDAMAQRLGPMKWWPARTPFEVIVGAILTQNTAWGNVERAIANLRKERLLFVGALEKVSQGKLARLVRSSGYFRQKAKKLKAFVKFLRKEYGRSLARMFRTPTEELRRKLLAVHGIGPETADSILLYAGGHAAFVVDAYTKRILQRHELVGEKSSYEEVRKLFETNLPRDVRMWNEYHALLVNVGKNWCQKRAPKCEECPLGPFLPEGKRRDFASATNQRGSLLGMAPHEKRDSSLRSE